MTTVNQARFTIDGTPSEDPVTGDPGYVAALGQTLDCTLEITPSSALSVTYSVFNPADETSPLASFSAANLTWVGSGLPSQTLTTPNATAQIIMPASGVVSYMIRCTASCADATYIYERLVSLRTATSVPLRKTVPAETSQYYARGWSDEQNKMVDAISGGLDAFGSAGTYQGAWVTDAGGGSINIAAGTGFLRTTAAVNGVLMAITWLASPGVAIPADTVRYVGVEYNAGTPQAVVRVANTFNGLNDFLLATVYNEAGTLHILEHEQATMDGLHACYTRFMGNLPLSRDERVGGLIVGDIGVRNLTMNAGVLYDGLGTFAIAAIDTSVASTFDYYYRDGGIGWTKVAAQTQYSNSHYDDNTGVLHALTGGNYGITWWYLESDGHIVALYGQGDYASLVLAQASSAPATVPGRVDATGTLIGRTIILQGAAAATVVESVYTDDIDMTVVINHNSLAGLQGGIAGQYYHLSLAQHTDLTDGGLCTSHVHSLDQTYEAAVATVTADLHDITWNLTGAFSHVINAAGCAGAVDGVFVEDGTDYWRLTHAAANTLNLSAELGSAAIGTSLTFELISVGVATINSPAGISLISDANDAGAHDFTIRATNAGAGTAILNIDAKDAITVDTGAGFSIDGVTASNVSTTTGTLTIDATAGIVNIARGAGGLGVNIGHTARAMAVDCDTMLMTASGVSGNVRFYLNANVAALRDFQIDAENANALGARITFSDSWQKDSAGAGGYSVAMPFGTTAAEWTLFKTNFGEVSLLNAINQCAASAVTLDEAYNAGVATITVDAYDVAWNLTGAFSFVVDASGCTGVADGFGVNDGADYFNLIHAAVNTLNLSADLGYVSIGTATTFGVTALGAITIQGGASSSITGGDGAGDNLSLISTSHGTKGLVKLGTLSAYDEVNDRLGIGVLASAAKLHAIATTEQLRLGYDAAKYTSFTTDINGDMTIAPTGGDVNVTGNLTASASVTGTATATGSASLGPELLLNGTFDSDLSNWTAGANWAWGAGGTADHAAGSVETLTQSLATTIGSHYQVVVVLSSVTASNVVMTLTGSTGYESFTLSAATTYTYSFKSGTNPSVLTFTPNTLFVGSITSVSLKLITPASTYALASKDVGGAYSGACSIANDDALFNCFSGVGCGVLNTTGLNNAGQGVFALYSNTTGSYNSAQGRRALAANTTGSYNSAQGNDTLFSNTTGSFNNAQGGTALYSNTTGSYGAAQGYGALYSNTTASFNTAQGYKSLYSLVAGSNTTAQGYEAGRFYGSGTDVLTSATQCLYLGASSRASADAVTNEIVIGYNAIGAGSNTATLGNTSVTRTQLRGNFGNLTGAYGTAAAGVLGLASGTAPTTSPADAVQMWAADRGGIGGKSALHMRTEDGFRHVFGDYCGLNTTTPAQLLDLQSGAIRFDYVPTISAAGVAFADGAAGVNTAGVHSLKFTAVNALGETELGTVSPNYTVATNEQKVVSNIPISPDPTVTSRNVYACKAGGAIWYLIAGLLPDNTTTSCTINVADASLVTAGPFVNSTSGQLYAGSLRSLRMENSGFISIGTLTNVATSLLTIAENINWSGINFDVVRDLSVVTPSAAGSAVCSFDTSLTAGGAWAYDHTSAFQDRMIYSSGGASTSHRSFFSQPTFDGAVGTRYGLWIKNPLGAGVLTANYGIYIEAQTRGTTDYAIATVGTTPNYFGGNIGIRLQTVITTVPSQAITIGGGASRQILMDRHQTADTAGNTLSVIAGGATAAATNKAGGNLLLYPGVSTGAGISSTVIYAYPGVAAATTDNTAVDVCRFDGVGIYVGPGTADPTAYLHLKAGGSTAGTAPIKLEDGSTLAAAEQGTLEYYKKTLWMTTIVDGSANVAKQSLDGALFSQSAVVTVANTDAETTLIGAGRGSVVLPIGFFGIPGKKCHVNARGYFSSIANSSLELRVSLTDAAAAECQCATASIATGERTEQYWEVDVQFVAHTADATSEIWGQGKAFVGITSTTTDVVGMPNITHTHMDFADAITVAVTADWNNANAGNTISCTHLTVTSID